MPHTITIKIELDEEVLDALADLVGRLEDAVRATPPHEPETIEVQAKGGESIKIGGETLARCKVCGVDAMATQYGWRHIRANSTPHPPEV